KMHIQNIDKEMEKVEKEIRSAADAGEFGTVTTERLKLKGLKEEKVKLKDDFKIKELEDKKQKMEGNIILKEREIREEYAKKIEKEKVEKEIRSADDAGEFGTVTTERLKLKGLKEEKVKLKDDFKIKELEDKKQKMEGNIILKEREIREEYAKKIDIPLEWKELLSQKRSLSVIASSVFRIGQYSMAADQEAAKKIRQ